MSMKLSFKDNSTKVSKSLTLSKKRLSRNRRSIKVSLMKRRPWRKDRKLSIRDLELSLRNLGNLKRSRSNLSKSKCKKLRKNSFKSKRLLLSLRGSRPLRNRRKNCSNKSRIMSNNSQKWRSKSKNLKHSERRFKKKKPKKLLSSKRKLMLKKIKNTRKLSRRPKKLFRKKKMNRNKKTKSKRRLIMSILSIRNLNLQLLEAQKVVIQMKQTKCFPIIWRLLLQPMRLKALEMLTITSITRIIRLNLMSTRLLSWCLRLLLSLRTTKLLIQTPQAKHRRRIHQSQLKLIRVNKKILSHKWMIKTVQLRPIHQ